MRKILACTGLMLLVTSGACFATCQSDVEQMQNDELTKRGKIATQDELHYIVTRVYGPVISDKRYCGARGEVWYGVGGEVQLSWLLGKWSSTLIGSRQRE